MAELTGCSAWQISRVENARSDVRMSTLGRILDVLAVDLEAVDDQPVTVYSRGYVDLEVFEQLVFFVYGQQIKGRYGYLRIMLCNPVGKRVLIAGMGDYDVLGRRGAIRATIGQLPLGVVNGGAEASF
jgi:hypothetical protein